MSGQVKNEEIGRTHFLGEGLQLADDALAGGFLVRQQHRLGHGLDLGEAVAL